MATIKKAQMGSTVRNTAKKMDSTKAVASGKNIPVPPKPQGFKSINDPNYKPSGRKYKNGGSLGMKSVKAGYDKNPGITRADIITAAKGKAKNGSSMSKYEMGGYVSNSKPKAKSTIVAKPIKITKGRNINAYQGKKGMLAKSGTTIKKAQGGMNMLLPGVYPPKSRNEKYNLSPTIKSKSKPKPKPKSTLQEATPEEIEKYGLRGGQSMRSGGSMKKCKYGCK